MQHIPSLLTQQTCRISNMYYMQRSIYIHTHKYIRICMYIRIHTHIHISVINMQHMFHFSHTAVTQNLQYALYTKKSIHTYTQTRTNLYVHTYKRTCIYVSVSNMNMRPTFTLLTLQSHRISFIYMNQNICMCCNR